MRIVSDTNVSRLLRLVSGPSCRQDEILNTPRTFHHDCLYRSSVRWREDRLGILKSIMLWRWCKIWRDSRGTMRRGEGASASGGMKTTALICFSSFASVSDVVLHLRANFSPVGSTSPCFWSGHTIRSCFVYIMRLICLRKFYHAAAD